MKITASIIIPAHNAAATLRRSAQSVLAQTRKDFELLIVDDGSTDGTAAQAAALAEQDDRVRVLYQPNGGVSVARNLGLRRARGELILFVDADDTVDPLLLQTVLPYLENTDTELLWFGADMQPLQEGQSGLPTVYTGCPPLDGTADRLAFVLRQYLNCALLYSVCNKVFRRSVIEKNGLCFDEGIAVGEDLAFCLKYLLCIRRAQGIPDILYAYWQRADSVTHRLRTEDVLLDTFSRIAAAVRPVYLRQGLPAGRFCAVFVKLMDNQLIRRPARRALRAPLRLVRDKAALRGMLRQTVLHPARWRECFPRVRYRLSRWLDCLYCLFYLSKGCTKGNE